MDGDGWIFSIFYWSASKFPPFLFFTVDTEWLKKDQNKFKQQLNLEIQLYEGLLRWHFFDEKWYFHHMFNETEHLTVSKK